MKRYQPYYKPNHGQFSPYERRALTMIKIGLIVIFIATVITQIFYNIHEHQVEKVKREMRNR